MDREASWATVHGVAKSQTWLKWLSTEYIFIYLLRNSQIISMLWLLWRMLPGTHEYRYLLEIIISFPLGIYKEAGLLNHRMDFFFFNSLRNLHTVCHSGYTNFHFHQQSTKGIFSYPHHQYLFIFLTHSNMCEKISHYVLIYISLVIISNVEHFFMYLLVICMSYLKKCPLRSYAHFLTEFFLPLYKFRIYH